MDLCQWANQADGTTPIEFEPSKEAITCRYANGVKLILDYLDTPFGNRDPKYHTELGTCPVRFVGDEGWVETGDAGDMLAEPASLLTLRYRRQAGDRLRRPHAQLPGLRQVTRADGRQTRG